MSTPSSTDSGTPPVQEQIVPPPPETPPSEATLEGDDFIRLSRKELAAEIDRLSTEDETFGRIWKSKVGEHAAKRYNPQLTSRDTRIQELEREIRRRDILAMSEEEIQSKFESDKDFALEYAEIVHAKPHAPAATPADETPIIAQAWVELRDWAAQSGLPKERWSEIETRAIEGDYQEEGVHWSRSLMKIQQEISSELAKTKVPPPPIDPSTTINPNLLKAGPDSASGTRGGAGAGKFPGTLKEFKAMTPGEQRTIMRAEGGKEHVDSLMRESQ